MGYFIKSIEQKSDFCEKNIKDLLESKMYLLKLRELWTMKQP